MPGDMSMRDWFAVHVPRDWMLDRVRKLSDTMRKATVLEIITKVQYEYADAMIAARKQPRDISGNNNRD